ncbi:hypothetical protein PanWU01x14_099520, partial [Parasponia andersonii]
MYCHSAAAERFLEKPNSLTDDDVPALLHSERHEGPDETSRAGHQHGHAPRVVDLAKVALAASRQPRSLIQGTLVSNTNKVVLFFITIIIIIIIILIIKA